MVQVHQYMKYQGIWQSCIPSEFSTKGTIQWNLEFQSHRYPQFQFLAVIIKHGISRNPTEVYSIQTVNQTRQEMESRIPTLPESAIPFLSMSIIVLIGQLVELFNSPLHNYFRQNNCFLFLLDSDPTQKASKFTPLPLLIKKYHMVSGYLNTIKH